MTTIDPTSSAIVLVHDGSERAAAGAPARDLSGNDIARLAYRRALAEVAEDIGRPVDRDDEEAGVITRLDPRQPDEAIVAAIVEELVASGRYAPPEPARKAKAADKPAEAPKDSPIPDTAATADKPEA